MIGNRAIAVGNWSSLQGAAARWSLRYRHDRGADDLASQQPERVQQMIMQWETWQTGTIDSLRSGNRQLRRRKRRMPVN